MDGLAIRDDRTLGRIVATLVALAVLAEHAAGLSQDEEHEAADRIGPAGGTLGQDGQGDERRHNPPKRPIVPYCKPVHLKALRYPASIIERASGV